MYKLRKFHIIFVFIFVYFINGKSCIIYGQIGNVWAFGDSAGLDFNNTPPSAIKTGISGWEGTASICDQEGKLLFYTEGTTVWDRNHQPMPNGADLIGLSRNITYSTTQGALIVPIPGKPHLYYVFSLACTESGDLFGNLYYSIVDMSLNNGKGDVISNTGATLLDKGLGEQMTAIRGDNCNIWLVVASRLPGEIRSYSITFDGIDTIPVVSPIIVRGGRGTLYGSVAVSPNRKKIAFSYGLVLYDFDGAGPGTGSISRFSSQCRFFTG
jgi:hypothetical protein